MEALSAVLPIVLPFISIGSAIIRLVEFFG